MSTSSSSPVCSQFSIKEIEDATNQFENRLLGKGAEAKVYFGEIYHGSNKIPAAIKHFQYKYEGFDREIETFSKIQHPNLVSLLGYCNESDHQVLVYEYMGNGSLADCLKKTSPHLPWLERLRICLNAACGLEHLHTQTDEYSKGIVHRDVKPANILVDENWVGKLSDFGMLKLSQADQEKSEMPTTLKGTYGFNAPEYVQYRLVTRRIDVFSFGAVLFQVLCGKSPWDRGDESYYPTDTDNLGQWAQQNIVSQIREEISIDALNLYTGIIGKSLKADPSIRPSMKDVVVDLRKALEFQKSRHSQKLTKSLELLVQGTTISRFGPASSSRFSIKQIKSALLAYSSSNKQFSIEEIKAALFSFCTFKRFSFHEIEAATNRFDETKIIGSGRESDVYLAEMYIDSNKTPVAVKRLKSISYEFEKVIHNLSKLQHPNLVSLIGYCNESGHHIFVYKYMAKGCLSDYLKKTNPIPSSWLQRINICLDVARALQYLHTGTDEFPSGLNHRGVTSDNILVDENWVGNLTDCKTDRVPIEAEDKSMKTSDLKGTAGYFAPEYTSYKLVSRKSDVYSFGVVLLQVLCRKDLFDWNNECYDKKEEDLGIWAQQNVDAQIKEEISGDCLAVYIGIMQRCLKSDPRNRPTMADVVMDLHKAIECQDS